MRAPVSMPRSRTSTTGWKPKRLRIWSTCAATVLRSLVERSEELDVEIGTTATELDSRRENDPREGDRDRQLLRAATGPDVALINGGGIRANKIYEPGTHADAARHPQRAAVRQRTVVLEVTERDCRHGARETASTSSSIATIRPPGGRTGARSDPPRRGARPGCQLLTLATNDHMARGGGGYDMLEDTVHHRQRLRRAPRRPGR